MGNETGTGATETKPGYQTTEFWLVIATNVANIILAMSQVTDAKTAVMLATIGNGIYAVARGLAKQGVAYMPPAQPDVPKKP